MLLKSLEIYGFKSFAERTKIQFDKGITGIVGPNGSGKSNVLDAIRWVLGEQSAKSLRGGKMEDIIFAGTQDRKSLGFAEVSLTLDNSSGKLPIEFSEVTITRRLYRSGESEYYINKTQCRLKDISELFMDTGVGKEGYSIIGQGKIDQILSSNTEDRRNVLEEAAGIVKYKTRREEAERKLLRTEENLTRVDDILHEISTQIGPLREESEKAKKYLQLREDLRFYELNDFVMNYNKLSQRIQKDKEQVELLKVEIDRERNYLLKNEQKRDVLKTVIDDLNNQVEEYNRQRHDIEYSIKALEGNIGIDNERINQARNANIRLENELNTENSEIDIKLGKIEQLNTEIIDKKNDRTVLLSREQLYSKKLESIQEKLDRYREEVSSFKHNLDKKKDELSKTREQMIHMETELRSMEDRIEQLHSGSAKKLEQLEKIKLDLQKSQKDIEDLTCEIAITEQKKGAEQRRVVELKETITGLDSEIMRISKALENNRTRLALLSKMNRNYEGYYRSVKAILSAKDRDILHTNGICGVVAQLMKVPEKLEKAVEMALGSSMQFIVTESEEDAKIAIAYLKENRYGRATFLPLTSIKGRGLSPREEQALTMDGAVGIGSELVKYDHRYADIFRYLLGRILIVDTMDDGIAIARRFSYAFKIVTLDGDLINPGGSMSGGSSPDRDVSILSRRREIEELRSKIVNLESKLQELHIDRNAIRTDLDTASEALKQLEGDLSDKKMKLAVSREKAQGLIKNIETVEAGRTSNAEEIQSIEIRRTDIQSQYELKLKEFKEIKEDIDSTMEHMDGWELDEREILQDKEELDKTLTEVKVKLASIEQEIISKIENRDFLAQEIDKHKKNIYEKKEQIKTNKDLCSDLERKNLENNKKIEERNRQIESIEAELEKCLMQRKDKEADIQNLHNEYRDLEERITDIIEKRHQIDIRISRTEVEMDNIQDNIWDDYNMSYSGALEYYDKELSQAYINKQIRELKEDIKDLGDISIGSIEQYKSLSSRYEFLQNQKFDLEMAMDDLQEVIGDITITMEEQFKREIKIISVYFNEVFRELFGGGFAKLTLKDESRILDSEIEIEAQPPGKKLQNISLLSGGEKALTAISLLFGILKRKPCPFCVLDEIDAPLDEGNLDNFCNFLNAFTDETQFVIITHRKTTMEASDVLYGITMEEKGISRMVSVRFDDIAS